MHYARVLEGLQGVEVIADCQIQQQWRRSEQQSQKTWVRFFREMPPEEPETESWQSETASVEHEIHGSPICFSGVKAWCWEYPRHIADAWT